MTPTPASPQGALSLVEEAAIQEALSLLCEGVFSREITPGCTTVIPRAVGQAIVAHIDQITRERDAQAGNADDNYKRLVEAQATITAQAAEIAGLKAACRRAGVCMACIISVPDSFGCTDCLNTGWEGGAPVGYLAEATVERLKAELGGIQQLLSDAGISCGAPVTEQVRDAITLLNAQTLISSERIKEIRHLKAELAGKDAEIARLRMALEPFAADADARAHMALGADIDHWPIGGSSLTLGHLRAARAALQPTETPAQQSGGTRLAPGCCSAISPCGHQQRDPGTLCDICERALPSHRRRALTPSGAGEPVVKAQPDEAALCLQSARLFLGWPTCFLDKPMTPPHLDERAAELADFLVRHRILARAPALSTGGDEPAQEGEPVTVSYMNWRCETSERTLHPIRLFWGCNQWHPEPQWLVEARDIAKGDVRTFALLGFVSAGPPQEPRHD